MNLIYLSLPPFTVTWFSLFCSYLLFKSPEVPFLCWIIAWMSSLQNLCSVTLVKIECIALESPDSLMSLHYIQVGCICRWQQTRQQYNVQIAGIWLGTKWQGQLLNTIYHSNRVCLLDHWSLTNICSSKESTLSGQNLLLGCSNSTEALEKALPEAWNSNTY